MPATPAALADARRGQRHDPRQGIGMDRQRSEPDYRDTDAKGQCHEGRHACHLEGVEPEGRIDPIAHRPARHDADPDRVAKAVAQKAAGRHDPQRHPPPQIAQRRPVIADQRDIARDRRRKRRQQRRPRRCPCLCDHFRRPHRLQQMMQRIDPQAEKPQPQDHRQHVTQRRGARPCPSVGLVAVGRHALIPCLSRQGPCRSRRRQGADTQMHGHAAGWPLYARYARRGEG